jgi:hypothetical protein
LVHAAVAAALVVGTDGGCRGGSFTGNRSARKATVASPVGSAAA